LPPFPAGKRGLWFYKAELTNIVKYATLYIRQDVENRILQYKVIFMKLSESEYSIMEIIWAKKNPVTSQDICELSDQRGWKAPTVLTFLKRLCEKGVLESEKIGKLRYYTPLISKEDYARSEATTLVNDLYDGKISNLVTSMAGQIALTQEDRQTLKKLLEGDWE